MKRKKTHKVVIFHLFDIHTAVSITNLFKQKLVLGTVPSSSTTSTFLEMDNPFTFGHVIETKNSSTIITIMIMIPVFKLGVFVDLGLVLVFKLGSCDGLELGRHSDALKSNLDHVSILSHHFGQ